jgi:hypothetical protein
MNETINVLPLAPALKRKPISQDLNIQKPMENLPGLNYLFQLVVCPSSGLRAETDTISQTLYFVLIESRTMDKVEKPSDSECYTPSSESFTFY